MVKEPDFKLLFGVQGGESVDVDGSSGKLIYDTLQKIVKNVNAKDTLKVKISLDDGAAKEFKEQIKGVMSGADTGVEVKIKGLDQTASDAGKAAKALDDVASSAEKAGQAAKVASVAENNSIKDKKATLKEVINLYNQIGKYIKKNSRAEGAEDFERLKDIYVELGKELDGIDAASLKAEHGLSKISKVDIKVAATEVAHLQRKLHEAGKDGMTFAEVLTAAYEKFGGWMLVTQSLTKVINGLKQMVNNVAQIDAAMTELRKVTDETDAAYDRFLRNASVRARELGATVADTVSAVADFARLGHSMEEATMLAEAALVYKNVGDGIDDISTASQSIISTMQAFGYEADQVMLIVDKFNAIGNKYAVSSSGLGEALVRSASAMAAANNTLDETIALATASNTILQNPEVVGTTMRSISMFLRAAKTEAEEAGESTDGMANSVSELRDEILALTGNSVDIQIDEDTYKSTYQILKEISEVWDKLTDISKANILEMIAGKRNANAAAAILENFDIAENVLEDAAKAAGSALRENEIYLDSIAGKTAKFQAAWQTLSATVVNSDLVKGFVDLGTATVDAANGLAEFLGGAGAAAIAIVSLGAAIKKFTPIKSMSTLVDGLDSAYNKAAGGAK